jgi:hypothetical protein
VKYKEGDSTGMEGNHVIKPLLSLHYFSKMIHTARMKVYTSPMPLFSMENDFCRFHDIPIGVEAQFKT